MNITEKDYVKIIPSKRQLKHQKMEFYAFFHFSMNTYTNREWGDGKEDTEIFYPEQLDARQWIRAIKGAGMKGAILTCKHHDGFCLWPSRFTSHSISASPYHGGKADIVKEVSDACKAEGVKFGIYLSPWDRNQMSYGEGKAYNDYFVNQLKELLTDYGEIFTVWLDGACGEGISGKKQGYDWERYYEVIRRLQPGACIAVCGPDIRWCGNEAGEVRPSEWSVVAKKLAAAERIQAASQQKDSTHFRKRSFKSSDLDLGSRKALEGEQELIWYPAEVNTSIRPGWFYHKEEDTKVKSLQELLNIYYGSVGGNSTFLLNIPPTPQGLIHENDLCRLRELGNAIQEAFSLNIAETARMSADKDDGKHIVEYLRKDEDRTFYKTKDGDRSACITVNFDREMNVRFIVLKENIRLSQRIEKFNIQIRRNNQYETVYEGTVVGYKKIVLLNNNEVIKCKELRVCITESRVSPTLSFLGIY